MQQLAEKQAEILIKEKIAEGAEKKEIMHILQIGSCPEGVVQELWKDHCSVTRLDLRNNIHHLDLPDEQFDLAIVWNVSWTLHDPVMAYEEWKRVLVSGGSLVLYDTDWHKAMQDKKEAAQYQKKEQAFLKEHERMGGGEDMRLPMKTVERPAWDKKVLDVMNMETICQEYGISQFLIVAEKKEEPEKTFSEMVENYWNERAEAFLQIRMAELKDPISERWLNAMKQYLPKKKHLKILDAGTGCGYFAVLLTREGHKVTGIDLSGKMLAEARNLAKELGLEITFLQENAQETEFADETFDAVVTRNLTWTLPDTKKAYEEWKRVLVPGGVLINFDAAYGKINYAAEAGKLDEAHQALPERLTIACDIIKGKVSISRQMRPKWDIQVLKECGYENVVCEENAQEQIYGKKAEEAPLFMLTGRKPENPYRQLETSVVDTLKEGQIKLGYSAETVRLYYPLDSLNELLGVQEDASGMEKLLAQFAEAEKEKLGEMEISRKGDRFCLAVPPEGMKYVYDHTDPEEFLVTFIRTIEKHGCTVEDLKQVFEKYSKQVHLERMKDCEFDYLIYFENGEPDSYRYCITEEMCHLTYHRFTEADYEAFHF